MFGFLPHNKNMAPLVNFKLTSVTLTQINTKPSQLISSWAPALENKSINRKFFECSECSKLCVLGASMYALVCVCVCVCVCVHSRLCNSSICSAWYFFHCSKRHANYWASGSVKCTAVVTVSARWTIELVYNLTVGGVSRSHPRNHPVALPSSANVNQQVAFKTQGNQTIFANLCLNSCPPFAVCKSKTIR